MVLNDTIASLNTNLANTKADLARTKTELQTTKTELAKTQDELKSTQDQLTQSQADLATANGKITDLNGQIDTLNKEIDILKHPNAAAPSGPDTPVYTKAEMDAVKKDLADATAQVAELNQVKDTLTNKVKDETTRADDLQKVVDHYKNGILKNGLEGEVLAFNPGWNFVVISIGDRQGAVANAEMILKRGDEQIGKVRITSVEPSTSVADIIPGSLAKGVRVEPGDKVLFPGN